MSLTQERAKSKLWRAARTLACALAILIAIHPGESRAEVWEWLTDLVQEDTENAALTGVTLPPDAIVTKRGETRTIQLGRDLIELHPSTAVTVDVSGKKTTVQVLTGTIRAKVFKRKKNETFRFHTVSLVGTVKGTEFEVSVVGDASAVSVYEGRVAVKAVGQIGGMDVTPGKTATAARGDREPTLGKTPGGGAPAAAKARSTPESKQAAAPADDPLPERGAKNGSSDASASGGDSSGKSSTSDNSSDGNSSGGDSSDGSSSHDGGAGESGSDSGDDGGDVAGDDGGGEDSSGGGGDGGDDD